MTKSFKAWLCCLLSVSLLIVSLAGCGQPAKQGGNGEAPVSYSADPNLNPLGQTPICKEPVELRIMMAQSANVIDLATNKYTKKIEEYGNVKLSFDLVPAADMSTKINLILNSGGANLPDIIISNLESAQVASFGANGMIIPLNQFYENSCFYLKKGLERIPEKNILKYITAADGNIYSLPQYNESIQNEWTHVMWIYKPWLDKLGLSMPKTLEEYRAVLKAFKDNDMNGNGDKTDELPLVDSREDYRVLYNLLHTFINFNPRVNKLAVEDGKLFWAFTDDRWKEGLKYIKSLVMDGLFTPVSFTMDLDQLKTIVADEENKVGSFSWTSTSLVPRTSKRQLEYELVLLEGKDGLTNTTYVPVMPREMFFITKNCKNPEAAFRIGDLMCSDEMSIWSRWGEQGVDWEIPAAGTASMFDYLGYPALIKPILAWGSSQNAHWENLTPSFRTYEVAAGMIAGEDNSQIAKAEAIKQLLGHEPKESVNKLILTNSELEEYTEIMQVADSYVNVKMVAFITGSEDIDSNWDGYLSELKKIGVERALKIAQTSYDRTKTQ